MSVLFHLEYGEKTIRYDRDIGVIDLPSTILRQIVIPISKMAIPMESEKQRQTFACSLCDFVADFHYKGKKPPFAKHIM